MKTTLDDKRLQMLKLLPHPEVDMNKLSNCTNSYLKNNAIAVITISKIASFHTFGCQQTCTRSTNMHKVTSFVF